MRRKLKLSSDGGDLRGKKCKQDCWRLWWNLAKFALGTAIWSQAVNFVLVRLAGRRHISFTFFCKFCAFTVINKENAEINYVTFQRKLDMFPSTLTVANLFALLSGLLHHVCHLVSFVLILFVLQEAAKTLRLRPLLLFPRSDNRAVRKPGNRVRLPWTGHPRQRLSGVQRLHLCLWSDG
jgi:hypothetical protein